MKMTKPTFYANTTVVPNAAGKLTVTRKSSRQPLLVDGYSKVQYLTIFFNKHSYEYSSTNAPMLKGVRLGSLDK